MALDARETPRFHWPMYAPRHFSESNPEILRDAVRRIGAGDFITMGAHGIEATFIPLVISDDASSITGHLAKGNPQWKQADVSTPALISWIGPDAYVSPSFYPSKLEHGRAVPTWNFIAVQARGTVTFHEDDDWKRSHVESLTNLHEQSLSSPWSVTDAPDDFIEGLIKAIVGVEIRVTSIEGKWKLSQNRSADDIDGVIDGLSAQEDSRARSVAEAMVSLQSHQAQ